MACRSRARIWIVLFALFTSHAFASGPYGTLADAFDGALANLTSEAPWGNPYLGGQYFPHCCLLAVNESLTISDGNLAFAPGQTKLRGSIEDLENNQFPCYAEYNGTRGAPPNVWVSYSWCTSTCPGFAMSWTDEGSLNLWLRPLVAFLAPAVIFALSVPRRRTINIPARLFWRRSDAGNLMLLFEVPAAALLATLDTIVWMIILISVSGPLLISGTYEAILDARILRFLESRYLCNNLTIRERAHLLAITLLGNLDFDPAWHHAKVFVAQVPDDNIRQRLSLSAATPPRPGSSSSTPTVTSQSSNTPSPANVSVSSRGPYDDTTQAHIDTLKLRLKAGLEAQVNFGTAVGAAVVFYAGGFIYTLVEMRDHYGDG